jgi:aryl-alcohol dehydrogenase-like predicted oxidoreductase
MCSRLAIGTVQFGLDYGIANQTGRVQLDVARNILQLATEHLIDTLDTAIAYGESENTLGQIGLTNWKVVTKLSAFPDGCVDIAGWVEAQIEGSLKRLGINQLHGVLLHRPEQLLGETGSQLFGALHSLKTQGFTEKIGVSVYAPEELDGLMRAMEFDLVQAPLNILDRRLIESGWASRLKTDGIEVHVRSAFLQGLLLMSADHRPAKFARWQSLWTVWERWLGETGLTPLQACSAYVLGVDDVDRVIVGVDSVKQLNEILDASRSALPDIPNWAQAIDSTLINPTHWG